MTAIHIPLFAPEILISGGGDPMLKLWDWMTGKFKAEVEVWDTVQKFLLAKGYKKIRGQWGKKIEDGATDGDQVGKTRKERREKNRKGKERQHPESVGIEGDEPEAESEGEQDDPKSTLSQAEPVDTGEFILVIHKIQTLELEKSRHIIFSAVGYFFLFFSKASY